MVKSTCSSRGNEALITLTGYHAGKFEPRYLGCYKLEIGIPCENRTHLNGFADRCLGCSANGIFECGMRAAEFRIWIVNNSALLSIPFYGTEHAIYYG